MKILFISNKYKRGEEERGPNYGYYNFYDSLVYMNNQSNEVIFFGVDEELMLAREDKAKVKEKLFRMIVQQNPRLVFFLEGELGLETLKEMRAMAEKAGAKTLWWVSDDSWMFDRLSKKISSYFHWVVSCDSTSFERHRKMGHDNAIHSQYACNHYYYKPSGLPKIYDVTFVGQPHSVRKMMIGKLKEAGINVKCWGYGWPQGVISQEEMVKVFSQSKINLNFNASSGAAWKKFGSIFLKHEGERNVRRLKITNPGNWADNYKSFLGSLRPQIHCRPFEVIGCGGFLLSDDADNFSDYYEVGKEIVSFKGADDLIESARYYLKNEEEREAIAKAGFERTVRDHTYEKRFNDIFKIMGLVN